MKKGSRQLYRKLLFVYTSILVSVVILLVMYSVSVSRQQAKDNRMEYMKMAGKEAREYIIQSSDNVDYMINGLYTSYSEVNDLCHYLTDSVQEYIRYRLDTYDSSRSAAYAGIEDYWSRMFSGNELLEQISVYSLKEKVLTVYEADGTNRRLSEQEYVQEASGQGLRFKRELRHPVTLEVIGWAEFVFSTRRLDAIVQFYDSARLLVYDTEKGIIYTSAKDLSWEMDKESVGDLEKKRNAYIWEEDALSCHILTFLPKGEANHIPPLNFAAIVGLGILLIIIGETGIRFYLSGIMKRLNSIVIGMEQVTTGGLNIHLECGRGGDELDIIADSFNRMCTDLDLWIKKSYLAEIEQKNAEMAALQSQINPHFLYNTLEAIRMKAITNGDREVGRMLYSMAALFQSQLKADDIIMLAQELHYSKKYMELFEYRYHDKFRWEVVCDEKYLQMQVIKFVIQPLLENYFAHGIRLESDSNIIRVRVMEEEGFMLIIVEDNGRGMPEEERKRKNELLRTDVFDSHGSMGMANVNRRLRAVYGDDCGLFLEESEWKGLKITLRFKKMMPENSTGEELL